jgi:uncharacterized membrane protein YccC
MIRHTAQTTRYFFYSRHVSSAILITAGVLLPSVILARYELFEMGVIVSLGALCVGVTDLPGPFKEKVNGMLVCCAINFLVALVSGYAGASVYLEGVEIVLLCFFFSMFTLYGARVASIGTTALMVMITMMYRHKEGSGIPEYAGLLLAGGLWYTLLSVTFYKLRPYREVQQVLGECILETTKALKLKANLYDLQVEQSKSLNALILEQIRINETQDDARQLLFTNPLTTTHQTRQGKILIAAFVELMDIYEQIVSTSYYETIRRNFSKTGVPSAIEALLNKMADNLRSVGRAIQANSTPREWVDISGDFIQLKKIIDALSGNSSQNTFILRKALITFRTLDQRIQNMAGYLNSPETIVTDHTALFRFNLFLSPKDFSLKLLLDNLSFQSSTFRYSLRVALVAIFGFAVSRILSGAGHSYWILFTIVFIMKPAFSLSKERNYQRIGGTLAGGLISFPVMLYVHNNIVLFILLMSFMIIAYSFMRVNYMVFVVFMTSYVLLMFKLLGAGSLNIIGERVMDTLLGASMAFVAIYFIFPNWEFKQIRIYIKEMLRSNRNYLKILELYFSGTDISVNDYKLARKDAYFNAAHLAGSFQRMSSEPKGKRKSMGEIQKFIVANHQLSSLISSNTAAIFTGKLTIFRSTPENLNYVAQSLALLDDALEIVKKDNALGELIPVSVPNEASENPIVKSQLKLIRERCKEILLATAAIFNS